MRGLKQQRLQGGRVSLLDLRQQQQAAARRTCRVAEMGGCHHAMEFCLVSTILLPFRHSVVTLPLFRSYRSVATIAIASERLNDD